MARREREGHAVHQARAAADPAEVREGPFVSTSAATAAAPRRDRTRATLSTTTYAWVTRSLVVRQVGWLLLTPGSHPGEMTNPEARGGAERVPLDRRRGRPAGDHVGERAGADGEVVRYVEWPRI